MLVVVCLIFYWMKNHLSNTDLFHFSSGIANITSSYMVKALVTPIYLTLMIICFSVETYNWDEPHCTFSYGIKHNIPYPWHIDGDVKSGNFLLTSSPSPSCRSCDLRSFTKLKLYTDRGGVRWILKSGQKSLWTKNVDITWRVLLYE